VVPMKPKFIRLSKNRVRGHFKGRNEGSTLLLLTTEAENVHLECPREAPQGSPHGVSSFAVLLPSVWTGQSISFSMDLYSFGV
jgi:hypothetical protein